MGPKLQLGPTKIFLQRIKDMKETQSFEPVFTFLVFYNDIQRLVRVQATGRSNKYTKNTICFALINKKIKIKMKNHGQATKNALLTLDGHA